jgi:hypothetical protein
MLVWAFDTSVFNSRPLQCFAIPFSAHIIKEFDCQRGFPIALPSLALRLYHVSNGQDRFSAAERRLPRCKSFTRVPCELSFVQYPAWYATVGQQNRALSCHVCNVHAFTYPARSSALVTIAEIPSGEVEIKSMSLFDKSRKYDKRSGTGNWGISPSPNAGRTKRWATKIRPR